MMILGQRRHLSLSLERCQRHWKGLTLVSLLRTHLSWRPKYRAGFKVHLLLLPIVFPLRLLFRRPIQPPSLHLMFLLRGLQKRSLNGLRGLWRSTGRWCLLLAWLECLSTWLQARRNPAVQKQARRGVDILAYHKEMFVLFFLKKRKRW